MNLPREKTAGAAYALTAYALWGLSPLYWRLLDAAPPGEVVMHRVVWSAAAMAVLLASRRRLGDVRRLLARPRSAAALIATTLLIGCNWYLYVKAVADRRVVDASLGYFINPLLSMSLGAIFLRERMRPLQALGVALAAAGMLCELRLHGRLPWLSLTLAATFSLYGLIRKLEPLDAMAAVGAETALLGLPCAAGIAALSARGASTFGPSHPGLTVLLAGSVAVTALPLVCFAEGAKRLSLKSMAFLQFSSPTLKLLVAVLAFGEPLRERLPAFALVWAAVGLYGLDVALPRKD